MKTASEVGTQGPGQDMPGKASNRAAKAWMLALPYPRTSGNGKTRHGPGNRVYSTEEARQYELDVKAAFVRSPFASIKWGTEVGAQLEVHFDAWPPDRRERDSDNVEKVLKDALTKAGAWTTDSNHLIRRSVFTWHEVDHEEAPNGVVLVSIKPFKESQ